MSMRLFGTVVTNIAPSANHTGESELNRSPLQKMIGPDGKPYAYFSSPSLRNGFRETARKIGLPLNRSRVQDANQPTVRMEDYPDPTRYFDDFVFGYLIAAGQSDRERMLAEIATQALQPTDSSSNEARSSVSTTRRPYRHIGSMPP